MKTFQEFQKDLHEVAPALLAAPLAIPALTFAAGATANYLKGVYQARKQGEGKRSQPVDYGQGEGSKPRPQATVRPAGPKADYKARLRAQQQARRAEVEANRQERAQQGIDQILGTDAERKAAAEARANQRTIQRDLRRKATRERMQRAAEQQGLN